MKFSGLPTDTQLFVSTSDENVEFLIKSLVMSNLLVWSTPAF